MKIKLIQIILGLIIVVMMSCTKCETISLTHNNYEIAYKYKSQFILIAPFSIDRSIRIWNGSTKKNLQFDILEDLESIDEPRFFYIDEIKYEGVDYQDILKIEDPFAIVLIELTNLKVIYNSHGEDELEKRLEEKNKTCLGKIRYRKLILDDCTIGFK